MATSINTSGVTFPDGTTQTTAASGSGGLYAGPNAQVFTSSGTFTVPTGVTRAYVTVFGGGGGGGGGTFTCCSPAYGGPGGSGGAAKVLVTGLTPGATVSVTVGGGGNGGGTVAGSAGGTSSFGAYVSCTGGGGGATSTTGAYGGVGSVTTSYQILQRTANSPFAATYLGNSAGQEFFGGTKQVFSGTGGPGMSGGGTPGGVRNTSLVFGYALGPGANGNPCPNTSGTGGSGGGSAGGTGGTGTNGGGGGGTGGVIVEW